MKGDHSDLRNLATFKRGHGSSITGAAFIQEFCEGLPWAHLDIAGVAFNENEAHGEIPKYATGWGIRLLWEFLTR
jgi:leucyl aminopeptidase